MSIRKMPTGQISTELNTLKHIQRPQQNPMILAMDKFAKTKARQVKGYYKKNGQFVPGYNRS